MQVILPALCFIQLGFSSEANAMPFVAIGGIIPGLLGGRLVNELLYALRLFVFQTEGAVVEQLYYIDQANHRSYPVE